MRQFVMKDLKGLKSEASNGSVNNHASDILDSLALIPRGALLWYSAQGEALKELEELEKLEKLKKLIFINVEQAKTWLKKQREAQ